ncbi:lipopolysaccharide biosynthesis protein [Bacillus benzoevorans]|uniref:O-antigen/teichoic acid export membrane protein n=1 Tax=Bacillus benzoevorans TaxID=1456 RepID=A0A7X0HU48_9BACI|nr:sugar translocase [Bacillus benzoevorans]MBB6446836.1 O-antigen/teichoic acid export membrane protein [Bacillus benzoevorans]
MSRTKASLRNISFAITFQLLALAVNFASRTVFIAMLGKEYLGLNGLFSNILSMLSLAELGIGTAIIFSLYRPLAENDHSKVAALMSLYKKAYTIIGFIVLILGLSIAPFLSFFIKEMPNIPGIYIIYIIFVLNAALSYFLIYKQSLIMADQKQYIVTKYRNIFDIALKIFQIFALLLTQSYFLFLILTLVSTLGLNLSLSIKADRMYPFLKGEEKGKLDQDTKDEMIKNVKGNIAHRIGGIIVLSTDHLLIARFLGIVTVGIYANYLLILSSLTTFTKLIYQSLTASIGNLHASSDDENKERIFHYIYFFTAWVYGFMSICLFILLNPFITLWLGADFTFSNSIVFLMVLNFFITGMRQPSLTFTDAMGLYWYSRHKPLFEAFINLMSSIYLVIHFGMAGVLLGTLISTMTTCFWVEPLMVFKYGFNYSVFDYFRKYFHYTVVVLLSGALVFSLSRLLTESTVQTFAVKMIICFVVPNIIFTIAFYRTKEFKYFAGLAHGIFRNILHRQSS